MRPLPRAGWPAARRRQIAIAATRTPSRPPVGDSPGGRCRLGLAALLPRQPAQDPNRESAAAGDAPRAGGALLDSDTLALSPPPARAGPPADRASRSRIRARP